MTITTRCDRARIVTIKRLLAHLVNEGLVHAIVKSFVSSKESQLCLENRQALSYGPHRSVKVGIQPEVCIATRAGQVVFLLVPVYSHSKLDLSKLHFHFET